MVYSGAWGKLINEKNQKSNISWHRPFKLLPRRFLLTIGNTQQFYFVILTICQGWDTGIQNQWENFTIASQLLSSSQT